MNGFKWMVPPAIWVRFAMLSGWRWFKWIAPLFSLMFGMVIGWWINQPQPSWMKFSELGAYYVLGTLEIATDGKYTVRRACYADEDSGPVIWRYEAIATDGQIAIYGPRPPAPSFSIGDHQYTGAIPLLHPIDPDGWVVRILITCPGEVPETITSPAARLQIVKS